MLYLKSWLQDYINLNQISSDDLANLISARSGEVESFTESNDYFNQKVLIGKVQNVRQHPDADRLKVFEVNLGNNFIQIVSAAENVFEGLICPVALVGCSLPGGKVIQERQMRGEISQGMCCGKSELLLETGFSSGLWELNEILSQKNLPLESFLGKNISQVLPEYFPVRFDQVKEKYGGLRLYFSGGDEYVEGLISMAEAFSYTVCEVCGNKGESNKGGWISTLCESCRVDNKTV